MVKQCIIIGGGPAGTAAALAAVESGLESVLLIERDAMGGTCTNRGCIPTKFLLSKSDTVRPGQVPVGTVAGQWSGFLKHKNALVQGLSRSIEANLRGKRTEIAQGSAKFINPHEIDVVDAGGGHTVYTGEKIIIAAGSKPAELPGSPSDGTSIITSDQALGLDPLPESLVIVGSGAVGAEFAFIFTRLGVRITLIEAAQRLFPVEDQQVDLVFRKIYERMGVKVHTGDPVARIESRDEGSQVAVLLASGTAVIAAKVLVAVGRHLETPNLDCQAAGIAINQRGGVVVDDDLSTSQPHIFAAGDVTGRMLLAHAASYMGDFAGRRAAGMKFPSVPYRSIPWATFTTPEVAAVGLTLEAAERSGLECTAHMVPLMDNIKARIDRTTEGFFKIVSEKETGRIIGGTIVGPHASDLIHVVALAIHKQMTRAEMRGFVFIHPSVSESIMDLFV